MRAVTLSSFETDTSLFICKACINEPLDAQNAQKHLGKQKGSFVFLVMRLFFVFLKLKEDCGF